MKQTLESGGALHASGNILAENETRVSEADELIDLIQTITADHKNHPNPDELGSLSMTAKKQDWSEFATHVLEAPTASQEELSSVKQELADVPITETWQLFQQLAVRDIIANKPLSDPFDFDARNRSWAERKAERTKQAFVNTCFEMIHRGQEGISESFKKMNTDDARVFHDKLTDAIVTSIENSAYERAGMTNVNNSSQAEEHQLSLLQRFNINPYQPVNQLRQQAGEIILDHLNKSDKPLQQLTQLARLDGQYIAGFLRSDEEFEDTHRADLVDLLTVHDSEQLIHLVGEGVISPSQVTASLARTEQHDPKALTEISLALPEVIDDTMLVHLAQDLPLSELYQLANDSKRWRKVVYEDPWVQASIGAQIEGFINDMPTATDKIAALNKFASFGPTEHYIAERKEELYEELLGHPNATKLDPIDQLHITIREQLRKQDTVASMLERFDDEVSSGIIRLKQESSPLERLKLLETVVHWRELAMSLDATEDEHEEVDGNLLWVASDMLSDNPDVLREFYQSTLYAKLVDISRSYAADAIARDKQLGGDGIFDNDILTKLARFTQDQTLATDLAQHLSPESITLSLIKRSTGSDNDNRLSWLQLVDPQIRQEFLKRASSPIAAGLAINDVFADHPEQKAAALMSFTASTGLGAKELYQLQEILDSSAQHDTPVLPTEARFLINLSNQIGPESTSAIMKSLPYDVFQGPNQEALLSMVNAGVRSNNVFLARFSAEHAKLFAESSNIREEWEAIRSRTDSYLIELAEISSRPEYTSDLSLLSQLHKSPKEISSIMKRFNIAYETYQNEMLFSWQSHTTGMTHEQIEAALASINELDDDSLKTWRQESVDLACLAGLNHLGPVLLEYSKHQNTIAEILKNEAVVGEKIKLASLLESGDLEQTIDILKQSASELSSSQTDAQRYAHIASHLVMKDIFQGKDNYRGGVLIPTDSGPIPLGDMTREMYESQAARVLTDVLEVPIAERNIARERNIELGKIIKQESGSFAIAPGSFIHATARYDGILGSANLAGEHLGVSNLNTDSFPGFVDLVQITDGWGELKIENYAGHKHRYGKNSALVYLPEAPIIAQAELTSGWKDHHLAFGGIPNTKLGFIIDFSEDPDHLESARQAQVDTGLYVPIVDSAGQLLFTPEEFQERHNELKKYQNVQDLVASRNVYSPSLHQLADPGGVGSIADHMERSVSIAQDFAKQAGLDDSTTQLVLAAMKLHDTGKEVGGAQEIVNVTSAREVLRQIDELPSEDRRRILLLIRHDELLGEVLKSFDLDLPSVQVGALPRYSQQKLDQFNRVFDSDELRRAAIVIYQSDVAAKRPTAWSEWQIAKKLSKLGLPAYQPPANAFTTTDVTV